MRNAQLFQILHDRNDIFASQIIKQEDDAHDEK